MNLLQQQSRDSVLQQELQSQAPLHQLSLQQNYQGSNESLFQLLQQQHRMNLLNRQSQDSMLQQELHYQDSNESLLQLLQHLQQQQQQQQQQSPLV
jgi:hypothetical protein